MLVYQRVLMDLNILRYRNIIGIVGFSWQHVFLHPMKTPSVFINIKGVNGMLSLWHPRGAPACGHCARSSSSCPRPQKKNTPEMDEETTFFQANHPVSRDGTICIYVHLRIYIYTHAYGNIWKYMEVHIYICMYVCVCLCVYYIMLYTHVHRF